MSKKRPQVWSESVTPFSTKRRIQGSCWSLATLYAQYMAWVKRSISLGMEPSVVVAGERPHFTPLVSFSESGTETAWLGSGRIRSGSIVCLKVEQPDSMRISTPQFISLNIIVTRP